MPTLTKPEPAAAKPRRRTASIILPALGIAVLLLFVGLLSYQGAAAQKGADEQRQSQDPTSPAREKLDMSRRIAGDPTAIGSADAPVVLVEYADYRCPFCGLFSRDTLPPLVAKYVERGDLRVEWRDLPVFGAESSAAAVAGRAAGEQGRFWEFNRAVYAIAPERGHAELPRERLVQLACDAGVPDLKKFEATWTCRTQGGGVQRRPGGSRPGRHRPHLPRERHPAVGAQPLATFEKAIDAALKSAKGN
jgi:protein-disulfide isomerase